MLDGKWDVPFHADVDFVGDSYIWNDPSSGTHRSLLKAKQYCSNEGKCFGILEVARERYSGWMISTNFPIRLVPGYKKDNKLEYGAYYIHKKEGNIVYHICLFIFEDK